MSKEEIVQNILSRCPNLTREKVVSAIEKKKSVSGGFLTDEAAARLVAVERGVEIQLEKPHPRINIGQLVSGLNDVTVSGRVLLVNIPQACPRPAESGRIARVLIADNTGTLKVILWNEKAKLAEEIQKGQIVRVSHGYVRRSKDGELRLHVGLRGDIQIAPADVEDSHFPSLKHSFEKVANIHTGGRRYVNVEGVIKKTYPTSAFQRRDGSQGRVTRVVLEDETGQIPAVFWNEKAEETAEMKEGTAVLLVNARVRRNRRDGMLELHVEGFSGVEILRQS